MTAVLWLAIAFNLLAGGISTWQARRLRRQCEEVERLHGELLGLIASHLDP
jgi:cytochrome c-type biogenesis protein CcmH/NrfF